MLVFIKSPCFVLDLVVVVVDVVVAVAVVAGSDADGAAIVLDSSTKLASELLLLDLLILPLFATASLCALAIFSESIVMALLFNIPSLLLTFFVIFKLDDRVRNEFDEPAPAAISLLLLNAAGFVDFALVRNCKLVRLGNLLRVDCYGAIVQYSVAIADIFRHF